MPQIINWPEALRPAKVEWDATIPQEGGRSQFDGSLQTTLLGAPMWKFSITTGPVKRSELPQWEALLDRLLGGVNRVRCWDWRREAPLGPATGAPVVRVAGAGNTLQLEGWAPNVAGILLAGSYLGINGELKRLSQSISSDASGRATVEFFPPLRAQAPAGAPVILSKPTALFVCTSDTRSMPQEGARFPGQTFSFEEVPA